jgi:hypothetical protein
MQAVTGILAALVLLLGVAVTARRRQSVTTLER